MSISNEIDRIHNDFYTHAHNHFYPDTIPDDAIFPDEVISEKIDNLKTEVSKPLEQQVKAMEKIADSAEIQANIAFKTSKKADIKGWIAVIISAIALLFEFAVNHTEITSFLKSLFNY